MPFTNQEKQQRFRQKEGLKKIADQIFKDWKFRRGLTDFRSPDEIRRILDKMIDLPSCWTSEDLDHAVKQLNSFNIEVYTSNPHLLQTDINQIYNTDSTATNEEVIRLYGESKKAFLHAKKLAEHFISTMDLFGRSNGDNAAAIMEVVRHIGLLLVRERKIPKSNATAVCLALINPLQEKPDWLISKLAHVFRLHLGDERARELGEKLIQKEIL